MSKIRQLQIAKDIHLQMLGDRGGGKRENDTGARWDLGNSGYLGYARLGLGLESGDIFLGLGIKTDDQKHRFKSALPSAIREV
jgi:hypothetical protein